jgi:hypothetical protein
MSPDEGWKTTLELPLGSPVGSILEPYVTVERQELLAGRTHDFFWVARGDGPVSYCSAMGMVRLRTKKRFGVSFEPHCFRTSLTTT